MRKILLAFLLTTTIFGFSTMAQSGRLVDLSETLSRQADELADRAYNDYVNRYNNNRSDVDAMMLAQQLSASANTFRRMIQDRRRDTELRDAASLLVDLSRRFPSYGSSSYLWRDTGRAIDDIARELQISGGTGGNGGNNNPPDGGNITGRVRWRGVVDNEIHLVINDRNLEVRTIQGGDNGQGTTNFTSGLPGRNVRVEATKIKGRGDVRVLQQPSKDNNFTAIIQVRDEGGGAREYEIEVFWRR